MNIRRAKKEDFKEVSKLLLKTFDDFLIPYFTKKSAEIFRYNQLSEEGLISRFSRIMFIAEEKNRIIGYVEADPDKIWLFFVDKKYQGKGIGKKLMNKIEDIAKKDKIKTIYVPASIYAVPIYASLGFKKTTGERKKNGAQYQPMKKILTKSS